MLTNNRILGLPTSPTRSQEHSTGRETASCRHCCAGRQTAGHDTSQPANADSRSPVRARLFTRHAGATSRLSSRHAGTARCRSVLRFAAKTNRRPTGPVVVDVALAWASRMAGQARAGTLRLMRRRLHMANNRPAYRNNPPDPADGQTPARCTAGVGMKPRTSVSENSNIVKHKTTGSEPDINHTMALDCR